MVTTRPPKTIVKPTALGPVANTDTKLLIYGLFQKGRVLAQDEINVNSSSTRAYSSRNSGSSISRFVSTEIRPRPPPRPDCPIPFSLSSVARLGDVLVLSRCVYDSGDVLK